MGRKVSAPAIWPHWINLISKTRYRLTGVKFRWHSAFSPLWKVHVCNLGGTFYLVGRWFVKLGQMQKNGNSVKFPGKKRNFPLQSSNWENDMPFPVFSPWLQNCSMHFPSGLLCFIPSLLQVKYIIYVPRKEQHDSFVPLCNIKMSKRHQWQIWHTGYRNLRCRTVTLSPRQCSTREL